MPSMWVDLWQEQVTGEPDGPGMYARRVRAGDREFLDVRFAYPAGQGAKRARQGIMCNLAQARALLHAAQRFVQEVEHEQE